MHCILNILKAARSNLEQAGIRLALVLNKGCGRISMHGTLTPRALQVCVVKRLKEEQKAEQSEQVEKKQVISGRRDLGEKR